MLEERDPDLNKEYYIRMDVIRGEHWSDISEEGEDKKNMHALKW